MDHKKKIKIIKSLLKPEITSVKNATIWPREIKLINQLFGFYPNDEFWDYVGMNFSLNSLAWFKTDDGEKELKRMWYAYTMRDSVKAQEILQEKVGEDFKETPQSPKNLAEFLNE